MILYGHVWQLHIVATPIVIEEVGYFDPYFRRYAEWDYAIRPLLVHILYP